MSSGAKQQQWGYTNVNGPHTWCRQYPKAAGAYQSPVNISSQDAAFTAKLSNPPLLPAYQHPLQQCRLINTGHSFQVAAGDDLASLSGGPLAGQYRFEQLHMHWGSHSSWGSEHALDGRLFAAELHLVHWNAGKFTNFQEAAAIKDGLAVLGVFVEVGEPNPELEKVLSQFESIPSPGSQTVMQHSVSLAALLPDNVADFFNYEGSLTTPPCFESVQWIVLRQPISMSEEQLERLRSLSSADGGQIENNYRPLVPLGSRKLTASFRD